MYHLADDRVRPFSELLTYRVSISTSGEEQTFYLRVISFLASASPEVNKTQPPMIVPPMGKGSPTTIPARNAFEAAPHNDSFLALL